MSRPLRVHRKQEHIGWLERTYVGSKFRYEAAWLAQKAPGDRGVAWTMPPTTEAYIGAGEANLPPYFVNLLPEGDLLNRLARRAKVAKDDLLGFLQILGADTVGDVWVDTEPDARERTLRFGPDVAFAEAYARLLADPDVPLPHEAISGVQPKMSASRVTLPAHVKAGPGAFLKLSNDPRYPNAPENEHFFMGMAQACGIAAARTALVYDAAGESALLVYRFDRQKAGRQIVRLHQEDSCQVMGIYPRDKYHVAVEEIGEALRPTVAAWPPVALELILQFAFGYLIGNGDQHSKNVSVLERAPGMWGLSPAYDMISTAAYGDSQLALALNGKKDDLLLGDFTELAHRWGVRETAVQKRILDMVARAQPWIDRVEEIGLDHAATTRLKATLTDRIEALSV